MEQAPAERRRARARRRQPAARPRELLRSADAGRASVVEGFTGRLAIGLSSGRGLWHVGRGLFTALGRIMYVRQQINF